MDLEHGRAEATSEAAEARERILRLLQRMGAAVDAQDASGIRKVIALVYRDDDGEPGGTGTATPYIATERNSEGVFELSLPDAFDNLISLQYVDDAGNITAKTLKGALLRAIEVAIRTTIINLGGIDIFN